MGIGARRAARRHVEPPQTESNLLTGRLFASDVGNSTSEPGNPPAHITDGSLSTRWISLPSSPANITTDLGGVYDLSRVVIVFAADTIRNYTVSVSTDGSTFTQVSSGTTNNTESQTVSITSFSATPKARYLRITAVDRWNAAFGNSLWEVEAYGTLDASFPVGTVANFTATAATNTQINLAWTYSGSALTNYTLRRGGTVIASPAAGATSYNDSGLTPGTHYTYTITGNYQTGGNSNTATASASTTGGILKVMPLGDSITEGRIEVGNTWQGGYRKVLLDRLTADYPGRVDFVGSLTTYSGTMTDKDHEGRYGWRADQINSNISSWAAAHQPDVVLLHIGTNDLIQGRSGSSIIADVQQIMTKIYTAKSDATIILCTLVPLRLNYEWDAPAWTNFNSLIVTTRNTFASQGRSVILADMAYGAGIQSSTADLGDGVHPSDSGYTKMANLFMTRLAELL